MNKLWFVTVIVLSLTICITLYISVSCPVASSCPQLTDPITGCTGSPPTQAASIFSYAFWDCSTPTVNDISPVNGTTNTDITLTGSGFSTLDCQNVISVGGHTCAVVSSSESSVVCRVGANQGATSGTLHDVAVQVSNRGNALNTVRGHRNRKFALMPSVSSVSPAEGSTEGGTMVTITGSGFSDVSSTVVGMGTAACGVLSVNYTQITCITTSSLSPGSADLQVVMAVNGGSVLAICEGACVFDFSTSQTPTVTSYSPTSVTAASSVFTVTGTGLGSLAGDITVTIGHTDCDIQSATDTEVTCNVGTPLVGTQPISIRHENRGYAKQTTPSVTVAATITSLAPSSGSTAGGTLLTITGLGFQSGDTTVTVGDNICSIETVTRTSVLCITPGGGAGVASVSVISNSVTYPSQQYTYDTSLTPTVSSVTPQSASPGDTITVTGTGYGTDSDSVIVSVGDTVCVVSSATDSSLTCVLGQHSAGTFDLSVNITPKGTASGNVQVTYEISVDSITPASGG